MTLLTLWDLIRPPARKQPPPPARIKPAPTAQPRSPSSTSSMQRRYDALVAEMKAQYGFRVRKWRASTTGCAWEIRYRDGQRVRMLESPYPRGPMSCAVFLHEVGHHAIGLGRWSPRCLEELKAWEWSLAMMREQGFNITPAVERRVQRSLQYAVAKARRRGLRTLPPELIAYAD